MLYYVHLSFSGVREDVCAFVAECKCSFGADTGFYLQPIRGAELPYWSYSSCVNMYQGHVCQFMLVLKAVFSW